MASQKAYEIQKRNDDLMRISQMRNFDIMSKLEGFTPSAKKFNPINDEMIKEYKKQFNEPEVIQGKILSFKAIPKPDLINIDLPYDPNTISAQRENYSQNMQDLSTQYQDLEARLIAKQQQIDALRTDREAGYVSDAVFTSSNTTLTAQLRAIRLSLGLKETQIRALRARQIEDSRKLTENEAVTIRGEKINQEKIDNYYNELKLLNSGSFDVQRLQGESDNDYDERIQKNFEASLSPEFIQEEAEQLASSKFRQNLHEIIRNEVLIDSISNSLSVEQKQELNLRWIEFKKKYESKFGLFNKSITIDPLKEFIIVFLLPSNYLSESLKDTIESSISGLHPRARQDEITVNKIDDNTLRIANEGLGKAIFLRMLTVYKGPKNKDKLDKHNVHVLASLSGDTGTFSALDSFEQLIEMINKKLNISPEQLEEAIKIDEAIDRVFEGKAKGAKINMIPDKKSLYVLEQILNKKYGIEYIPTDSSTELKKGVSFKDKSKVWGNGIKSEDIPDYSNFGNVAIHHKKLFYDNILSIKDSKGRSLAGLPNTKVSDNLGHVILKSIKGDGITHSDIKLLKPEEKHLYDHLINISKLHKKFPHTTDSTLQELKHQYEILTGEYNAGNDSIELKKQLYYLLHSLKNLGAITNQDLKQTLKDIK
jgi:hypothetical protein